MLDSARSQNKKVFINMHDYGDTTADSHHWNATTIADFDSIMTAYSDVICAMFVGHYHSCWGQYAHPSSCPATNAVCTFYTGSAPFQTYSALYLDPLDNTYTVLGVSNDRGQNSARTNIGNAYTNVVHVGSNTYTC